MKLIVGLGNYPKEYEFTRHNAGFLAIDDFCKKNLLELKTEKFNGLYVKTDSYIISKPLTFMNNSGDFVREIVKFFKIDIKDILIITDDIDSNFGSLKFRSNGSSGGQNGLKDIFNKLGTEEIKRIKIGTGRPIPPMKVIDWVLSRFKSEEMTKLQTIFKTTSESINDFINDVSFEKIASKYSLRA